ncbi:MAG: hydroxymethylglutaryl-CoA synthase [Pseudomonadales bacterium]
MSTPPGISGFAAYFPPYRVCLDAWSEWTGNNPDKIRAVVGRGFRMRGPEQSVYTLAATAVLRLIRNYDIDPGRVTYLGFGTESSTDNSAGAVIIKGMVNDALRALGLPVLPRGCEVPEFKHACLGGVYAIKGALRYLATDGAGDQAIVVSADLAQYERGSSGEQTQGAGAVALLLEENPRIASLDLARSGKSSDYRTLDFRKPFVRFNEATPGHHGHLNDFPLFNGPYSTACYLEATVVALRDLFRRTETSGADHLRNVEAIFMHRPYQRMPETGLALAYLFALEAGSAADVEELRGYCALAGEGLEGVREEMRSHPAIGESAAAAHVPEVDPFPKAMNVLRAFRGTEAFRRVVADKLRLGEPVVAELGNLYTASLPAWLAAGFEDALARDEDLTGKEILMIGYGSGDAAEAIPLHVVPGWAEAASKIGMARALEDVVPIDREQYEVLHAGGYLDIDRSRSGEFVVTHIGERSSGALVDAGIEYHRFVL